MSVTRIISALSVMMVGVGPNVSTAAPLFYSGKEIRATVLDAATGKPVEGVVVVAVWQLTAISGEGPRLQVGEAVTDAAGAFFMPSWGPKAPPPLTEAQSNFPYVVVFKHGYVPAKLHNAPKSEFARIRSLPAISARGAVGAAGYEGTPSDTVQESVWNGMSIAIEPFRGTPEEWFHELDFASDYVLWQDARHTRRFFEALAAERAYFSNHPVDPQKVTKVRFQRVFNRIDDRLRGRTD